MHSIGNLREVCNLSPTLKGKVLVEKKKTYCEHGNSKYSAVHNLVLHLISEGYVHFYIMFDDNQIFIIFLNKRKFLVEITHAMIFAVANCEKNNLTIVSETIKSKIAITIPTIYCDCDCSSIFLEFLF